MRLLYYVLYLPVALSLIYFLAVPLIEGANNMQEATKRASALGWRSDPWDDPQFQRGIRQQCFAVVLSHAIANDPQRPCP